MNPERSTAESEPARAARYVATIAAILALALSAFLAWATIGRDHLGAISLADDEASYRNLDDQFGPEIQDLDIFYHNIGRSIANARKADVIILGSSFSLFAIDHESIEEFATLHNLRIFNLSFVGVRSGEFVHRIIKRWHIRPRLWIINADDAQIGFFSDSTIITFGDLVQPISSLGYGRAHAIVSVFRRNLQWRLGDFIDPIKKYLSPTWSRYLLTYRRVQDGNLLLEFMPRYLANDNAVVSVLRKQDCHTNDDTIRRARDYINDIGGDAILTLVPTSEYCPRQAIELAKALHVDTIIPPNPDFTSIDRGGHLDKRGAVAFTGFLLSALEHTEAFARIVRGERR
jgi:hypothetical protein